MSGFKRFIYLFLVLFFLSALSKNFLEYRKNMEFYNGYQKEYNKEKEKNTQLKALMVKTNDTYEMEKIIRNKLNLTKENETVIVLPNITPTPTIAAPTPAAIYEQWWTTFTKN